MSIPHTSVEERLRAVEDTLAIYHLIASHPPATTTAARLRPMERWIWREASVRWATWTFRPW